MGLPCASIHVRALFEIMSMKNASSNLLPSKDAVLTAKLPGTHSVYRPSLIHVAVVFALLGDKMPTSNKYKTWTGFGPHVQMIHVHLVHKRNRYNEYYLNVQ